ncbi:hypothetical protein BGHDH14_bghG001219000001001 [Blumeria hordei DH14]|uniref:Uncharacterized protein n=1 Tax=Blumeria graminis f. sp. hordei (strain DH14) TaxID=546991 RepID=N1JBP4_BLUG1|nr:hypothetical protein BGHDH14_bghG001219000001001 [Blumeria hordei DH14]
MSDTRPTVAELVERLHSNIDWISKTVLQLSDDTYNREIERLSLERESAIHSLREERVDALKKLLAERAAEKEETEIRRQREKEVIDEKRAREWEEILIRRKKEDLERIRILEIEDLEKERIRSEHDEERERQREEEERSLFEKCEDEIERLENEAHRKIEEGQAELKKLDEDRKIINQQIEAALKAPAVIPKIKLRTRRPRTLEFSRTGAIEHLHKRSHTSLITPKSVTSNRDISSPGNNFEPDAGRFTPLFMNHENLDIHQTEECHKNQGKEEALPGLSAMKNNRSLQSYDLQKETIETNMNECLESEALTNEIFTGQKTDFFSNSFTSQLANSSKDNDQQFHTKVSTQVISGEISQNSVLSLSKDISPNELYRIEPEKESSNEGQILSKETSDCVHEKIDTQNLSRDLNNLQTHSISEKYDANLDFHASKTRIFDSNGYSDEISSVESSKRENKNEKVNDVDYIKHSSSTVIPEYKEDFHISIPSDETSSVIPSLVSNSGISTGGNVKLAEASKEKEELDSRVNEIRNNLVAKNEYETLTHEYVEIETNAFDSITPLNSKETSNDYMEQSNAFKSLQSITLSEVISPKDQIPDILKESISFHDTNQKKLDSSTYERNLPTVNSKLASSCQSLHSTENSSISITHLFETKILTSEKASALEIDPDDNINSLQISSLDDAATNFNNLQNFQQHPSCNIDKSLILHKNYFGSTSRPEKILPDASDYGLEIISDTRDHIYQTSGETSTQLFNVNDSAFTSEVRISSTINNIIPQSRVKSRCTTEVIQISDDAKIEEAQVVDTNIDETSNYVMKQESLVTSRVETSSSSKESIECTNDVEKMSEHSAEMSECTTEVVYTTEVIQISDEAEIEDTEIKEAQIVDATSDESSTHVIEQESLDTSKVETSSSSIETIESTNDEEKSFKYDEAEIEDTEIKEAQIVDATIDESSTHIMEQESLVTSRVEMSSSSKETIECTTEVVYTTEVIQISDEAEIEDTEIKEAQIVDATSDESSTHVIEQESLDTSKVETSSSSIETIECTNDEEKVIEQSEEKTECTTEVIYTTEVIQISDEAEIEDTEIKEAQIVDATIDESSTHVMEEASFATLRVETSSSSKETIECTTEVVYTTEVIQISDEAEIEEALCEEAENKEAQIVDATSDESSTHVIEQESLDTSKVETSSSSIETIECTTEVVYTTEVIQISDEAEIEDTEIKEAQIVDATSDESSTHVIEQESLVTSRVETSSSSKETIECTNEVVYTTEVIQISDEAEIEDTEIKEAQIVDAMIDESSTHIMEHELLVSSRVETSSFSIDMVECTNDEEKVSEQAAEMSECTTEVVYTTEVNQLSDEVEMEDAQIVDANTDESSTYIMEQETLVTSKVETSSSSIETIECTNDQEKVTEQSAEISECTTEVVNTTEVIQVSDEGYYDINGCSEVIENRKYRAHDISTSRGNTYLSLTMKPDKRDVKEDLTSSEEFNKCIVERDETPSPMENQNEKWYDDVKFSSMKNLDEDLSSASGKMSLDTEIDKIFSKGAETSNVDVDIGTTSSLRYKRNIDRDLNALSGWDKTSIKNSDNISNAQPSFSLPFSPKMFSNTEKIHPSIESEGIPNEENPETLMHEESQLCIDITNQNVQIFKGSSNLLETYGGHLKIESIGVLNQEEMTKDTEKLNIMNEPTLKINQIHTSYKETWSMKPQENTSNLELHEDKIPTSCVMEEFFDCYSDNSNYELTPGQDSENEALNIEYTQSFTSVDEKSNDFITHEQPDVSEDFREGKEPKSNFQQDNDNLESISEVDEICNFNIIENQTSSRPEEISTKIHQKSSDSSRYSFKADQEIFTDPIEDIQKLNHRHEFSNSISESIPTYNFSDSASAITSPSEAPSSPFHENPIDEPIISSTWRGNMTGPDYIEAQDFKAFSTVVSKKYDICESYSISDLDPSLENQVDLSDRPSEDNLTETPLTSKNLEQLMIQQKGLSESNPDSSNPSKKYPTSAQTSKIMTQQRISNTNIHENSPTSSVNSINTHTKNNTETKPTSPVSSLKSNNLPSSPFQKARALFESQQQNKQQFKQNPTRPLSGFFAHRGVGLPAYSHSPSNLHLANFRTPIMEVNETREKNEKIEDPSVVPLPNSPDGGSASALSSHSIHSTSYPGTWSPQTQAKAAYRPNTPERSRLLFFENLQRSI